MSNHSQKVRFLYKAILKLHRGLPSELSELGTNYARDEFRRHKNCNEKEAVIFINEWTDYAITLSKQMGYPQQKQIIGKPLSEDDIEKLRNEQIHQLYELMVASKNTKEQT